jgi:hypothetical protein
MAPRSALSSDVAAVQPVSARRIGPPAGQLVMYAALGAIAGALPVPWVPDALLARLRGALAHELAARHGVSLTPEAREVLAEPGGASTHAPTMTTQALRFLGVRLLSRALARFGPFGLLWPAREAMRVGVFGHLFGRYLDQSRVERAIRVDRDEARRVRRAIDGAVVRAFSVGAPPRREAATIDDQRDPGTALVDGLIGVAADLPSRLTARLEAAFDELLASADG